MTTAWILLGVAALLIIGNAFFVAAETGLVTIDRNLVEARAADGTPRFGTIAASCDGCRPTCQGLNSASRSPAWRSVWWPNRHRDAPPWTARSAGTQHPGHRGGVDRPGVAHCDGRADGVRRTRPQNIALSRPVGTLRWVVLPLLVFTQVTRPLVALPQRRSKPLLRLVGVEPVEEPFSSYS